MGQSDVATMQPFRCAACASPLPLGESDLATCRSCGRACPIPEDYRQLRNARRLDARDLATLDALFAELSQPPGRLSRFWVTAGRWTQGLAIVATIGVTLFMFVTVLRMKAAPGSDELTGAVVASVIMCFLALPATFEWVLHVFPIGGVDLADWLGPFTSVSAGFVVYLLVMGPIAVGRYCDAALTLVQALQQALRSKRSPSGDGENCRSCGGALDVRPGALGARCVFCATDNLLAVGMTAAIDAKSKTESTHRQVEAAAAAHQRDTQTLRGKIPATFGLYLFIAPVLFGLGLLSHMAFDNGVNVTLFHRAPSKRGALYAVDPANMELPRGTTATAKVAFPKVSCDDRSGDQCAYYFVSLERGERLPSADSPTATFAVYQHTHSLRAFVSEGWRDVSGANAPYSGWYRAEVRGPPGATSATVTFSP